MKFLEKYDFTKEDISNFVDNSPKKLVESIKEHKKLVGLNIEYLQELGITNYKEVFLNFYDMFLMDNSNFIEVFAKYDREDLIDKVEKNVSIVEYL